MGCRLFSQWGRLLQNLLTALCHFFIQSSVKRKPVATHSHISLHTWHQLQCMCTCICVNYLLVHWMICALSNRTFSKMAAENSNKSKLKTCTRTRKNTFASISNPAKFQHFKCNISWENVSWKLKNLQLFVWLGVCMILIFFWKFYHWKMMS